MVGNAAEPKNDILDLVELRSNLGGADDATISEVIGFFVTSVKPLIVKLGGHAAARQAVELEHAAHAAKGAARNVCAPTLAELLAQLESAARQGDWPAIDAVTGRVTQAFDQVADQIAAAK